MQNFGEPLTAAMDNVLALKLGRIARKVQDTPRKEIGDDIDRGLILRRYLEDEGFYLVRLTRVAEQRDAPVRIGAWVCNHCDEINESARQDCSRCGRPR